MIIKQKGRKKFDWSPIFWTLPLLFVGFLLLPGRKNSDRVNLLNEAPSGDIKVFENNLEQTFGDYFIADSFTFEGAHQQSSDYSYSGNHSIALTKDQIYGLSTWYLAPSKDATYHLSIRRYNPDSLQSFVVISAADSRELYVSVGGRDL